MREEVFEILAQDYVKGQNEKYVEQTQNDEVGVIEPVTLCRRFSSVVDFLASRIMRRS
jgi:hypothetical protein